MEGMSGEDSDQTAALTNHYAAEVYPTPAFGLGS